jgi:hypothetical protein
LCQARYCRSNHARHCQSMHHVTLHAEAAAPALDAARADKTGDEHHQQRHDTNTAEGKHRNKRDKEHDHELQGEDSEGSWPVDSEDDSQGDTETDSDVDGDGGRNQPYSSDEEERPTKKQKWVDVIHENYTRAPAPNTSRAKTSSLKQRAEPVTADTLRNEQPPQQRPDMDHGARLLVGQAFGFGRQLSAGRDTTKRRLPTPAETAYHLRTTDFLVTLNKQQLEQYAALMDTVVKGIRNDMEAEKAEDDSEKVFLRTKVLTTLPEINKTYLKGPLSIFRVGDREEK